MQEKGHFLERPEAGGEGQGREVRRPGQEHGLPHHQGNLERERERGDILI